MAMYLIDTFDIEPDVNHINSLIPKLIEENEVQTIDQSLSSDDVDKLLAKYSGSLDDLRIDSDINFNDEQEGNKIINPYYQILAERLANHRNEFALKNGNV